MTEHSTDLEAAWRAAAIAIMEHTVLHGPGTPTLEELLAILRLAALWTIREHGEVRREALTKQAIAILESYRPSVTPTGILNGLKVKAAGASEWDR